MGEWGIGNSRLLSITPIDSSYSGTHQKKVYILKIFDKGYATTKVDVAQGKVKAEIKNLTAEEQIAIENDLSEYKGKSQAYILHQYSLKILEKTLIVFKIMLLCNYMM